MLGRAARRRATAALFALAALTVGGPAGADEEDLVEIVEGEDARAPSRTAAAQRPDRIEVRGFTRVTVAAGLEGGGADRATPEVERVAHERGSLTHHGYVDVRYSRGDHLQAVLSGSLAYGGRLVEGGPTGESREAVPSRVDPVLREAYVGIYSGRLDLRLGQQRIAWGSSESVAPNDVLNARDLRDRMQLDPEMVHLPTLAARADLDLGVAVLGLVAQPFFVPDRVSVYGGRWSLIQADAPSAHRRLFGLGTADNGASELEVARSALVDARAPKGLVDGGSLAASVRVHGPRLDASFYYHWGLDRSPFVYLDPQLAARIQALEPGAVTGGALGLLLEEQERASAAYGGPLVVQYYRRHHVGFDAARTAGPFVLRADAAFDSAMSFFARDTLNSVARPAAQAVVGAEYQTGNLRKLIAIEGWVMRVLDAPVPIVPVLDQANRGAMLFAQDLNLGLAAVLRWELVGDLVLDVRAFLGATPLWIMARPEIGWDTPSWTLRAGLLVVDGEDGSTGRYYRRNDTAYLTARYAF